MLPGTEAATTTVHRRSAWLAISLAVALFWAAAAYGFTSPFYYGHYGYHGGSYATWARGTIRHHTIYPVNETGFAPPRPHTYYIHHPVLPHQLVTLTFLAFGEHEWSVRLAALISSFASLLVVTALAWRYLGPLAGGAASLVFAIVPVNIWYAAHMDQGFPSIACLLAFFWFYKRWLEGETTEKRWRFGAAALVFQALAGGFEWSPYFAFVPIFVHVVWTAWRRRGRFITFAALHPLTVIAPLGIHAWLVVRSGMLNDILGAYRGRAATLPYRALMTYMWTYAKSLFGPVLVVVMLAWLLLALSRIVRRRSRALDLVGITFAFAQIVYIHVFPVAIQTHAYRQLYGNVWATVAVADLVALLATMAIRFNPRLIATGVAAVILLATAPTSWAGLMESRAHGGVPGWTTFKADLRQTAFAAEISRITKPGDVLYFHRGFGWPPPHRMDWAFYYDRDSRRWITMQSILHLSAEERRHAVVLLLATQVGGDDARALAELASAHPFVRIDDLAYVDLRTEGKRFQAFRTIPADPRRKSALRRWLEGPYPFPTLVPVPETAAADEQTMTAAARVVDEGRARAERTPSAERTGSEKVGARRRPVVGR